MCMGDAMPPSGGSCVVQHKRPSALAGLCCCCFSFAVQWGLGAEGLALTDFHGLGQLSGKLSSLFSYLHDALVS